MMRTYFCGKILIKNKMHLIEELIDIKNKKMSFMNSYITYSWQE